MWNLQCRDRSASQLLFESLVGYQGRRALESEVEAPLKKAVQAIPLDGFRLWLKYADSIEGTVDLSDLAGRGVFEPWSGRKVFEAVTVNESGAIVWPGDIDLCPDALYLRLTGRPAEEIFPGLKRAPVDA